jgi:hypothetical protein
VGLARGARDPIREILLLRRAALGARPRRRQSRINPPDLRSGNAAHGIPIPFTSPLFAAPTSSRLGDRSVALQPRDQWVGWKAHHNGSRHGTRRFRRAPAPAGGLRQFSSTLVRSAAKRPDARHHGRSHREHGPFTSRRRLRDVRRRPVRYGSRSVAWRPFSSHRTAPWDSARATFDTPAHHPLTHPSTETGHAVSDVDIGAACSEVPLTPAVERRSWLALSSRSRDVWLVIKTHSCRPVIPAGMILRRVGGLFFIMSLHRPCAAAGQAMGGFGYSTLKPWIYQGARVAHDADRGRGHHRRSEAEIRPPLRGVAGAHRPRPSPKGITGRATGLSVAA